MLLGPDTLLSYDSVGFEKPQTTMHPLQQSSQRVQYYYSTSSLVIIRILPKGPPGRIHGHDSMPFDEHKLPPEPMQQRHTALLMSSSQVVWSLIQVMAAMLGYLTIWWLERLTQEEKTIPRKTSPVAIQIG